MPFGIIGRTGPDSRDDEGSGVWVSREGVLLGANLGRAIITNGDFWPRCATVPQPSELRFGVVRALGRGIAVLDGRPRRARGRGGFGGFCSPFLQWQMPFGRQR